MGKEYLEAWQESWFSDPSVNDCEQLENHKFSSLVKHVLFLFCNPFTFLKKKVNECMFSLFSFTEHNKLWLTSDSLEWLVSRQRSFLLPFFTSVQPDFPWASCKRNCSYLNVSYLCFISSQAWWTLLFSNGLPPRSLFPLPWLKIQKGQLITKSQLFRVVFGKSYFRNCSPVMVPSLQGWFEIS